MRNRRWLLVSGTTALVVLGLLIGALFVVPALVSAHSAQTMDGGDQTNYCQQYTEDLAQRLNVSVDTLKQARAGAFDDVLAQLVQDGKITQTQADKIKQYRDAHKNQETTCKRFMFKPLTERELIRKYGPDVLNAVAQKLNLSADQLKEQLKNGKTLEEIAQAQNVSMDDLRTTATQAINAAIDKAVSAGDLTQKQGDTLKQSLSKHPLLLKRWLIQHWKEK